MRRIFILWCFLFCFLFTTAGFSASVSDAALSLEDAFVKVADDVGPAVVSISTEHTERYQTLYYPFSREDFGGDFFDNFFNEFVIPGPEREFKRIGLGSGVIIDPEGHILTNEHVIHGSDKITVTLPDGREFEGQLTGSDIFSDLAIIKINPEKENLPYAKLGDSDKVKIGQWSIAIGNPYGFAVKNPEPTVTVGVISALNRGLPKTSRRDREYSDLIQTDAAINPGNSGGPLLNIYGEIIGINVAIFTTSGGSQGIGFAIPVNTAKKIMKDLIEGKDILHGWIGVLIQDINPELAAYLGLKETQGVLVSDVVEQGPAEEGGLQTGDIITSIEGVKIRNTSDLIRMVLRKNVGDIVSLDAIRNGKPLTLKIKIGVRPEEQEKITSPPAPSYTTEEKK